MADYKMIGTNDFFRKKSDCNNCKYLDTTTEICKKYNKKVYHYCALSVKPEEKLYPLRECDETEWIL